jgi:hypothetical protein
MDSNTVIVGDLLSTIVRLFNTVIVGDSTHNNS